MRIIFSRDRAAQLDLLLASLERNAEPEETAVIYRASDAEYARGYAMLLHERRHERRADNVWLLRELQNFEWITRGAITAAGEFVTFLCDDDILYRELDHWTQTQLVINDDVLCFSSRLGQNTQTCYPTNESYLHWPGIIWNWQGLPPDFGYPGSLDGHIFRTADVLRMLDGKKYPNPTALECALVEGCNELADERPLMACYPHSVLVGNPVNRVSDQSNVRHGDTLIYSARNLNDSYLAGMRLDLDAIDFTQIDGAHTELDLKWKAPVPA